MKWVYFKDEFPDRDQEVLVYRSVHIGGYPKGIYTAICIKEKRIDEGFRAFIVLRDDSCTNKNNYRPVKEFLTWMPLPELPTNA